jgi:hypothetical protein
MSARHGSSQSIPLISLRPFQWDVQHRAQLGKHLIIGVCLLIGILGLISSPAFGQGLPQRAAVRELPEEPAPQPGKPIQVSPEDASSAAQPIGQRRVPSEQINRLKQQLLDILAVDQGTSVTTFLHRFQISTEYRERPDGAAENQSVLRIDQPLGERGVVRMDARYRIHDSGSSGIGDLLLRTGYRVLDRPGFQFFAGIEAILPTTQREELGRGKYELGPGIAASWSIPEINSSLMPTVQSFKAVGGDPERRDVNYSLVQLQLVTPWTPEWWTLAQTEFRLDWERNRKTSMMLEGEVGRKFGPNYRAWLRTGGTLWGAGVVGTHEWFAQIGIRYLF